MQYAHMIECICRLNGPIKYNWVWLQLIGQKCTDYFLYVKVQLTTYVIILIFLKKIISPKLNCNFFQFLSIVGMKIFFFKFSAYNYVK